MYQHSTAYYDLIYRELKDYRDEAAKIHGLLLCLPELPKRILDVGCGTGEHARILAQKHGYEVDGIDIQPGFIEIASQKLPESRFAVADMRDFQLDRKYEAILCLFSSIGYVETLDGLRRALSSMARHLEPNGRLICEPWVPPELWIPGQSDSVTTIDPSTGNTIHRTRKGRTDGEVSVLEIDYYIEGRDTQEHFAETHRLGLFSREETNAALEQAGLKARWLPRGLQSPTLFIAQLR